MNSKAEGSYEGWNDIWANQSSENILNPMYTEDNPKNIYQFWQKGYALDLIVFSVFGIRLLGSEVHPFLVNPVYNSVNSIAGSEHNLTRILKLLLWFRLSVVPSKKNIEGLRSACLLPLSNLTRQLLSVNDGAARLA